MLDARVRECAAALGSANAADRSSAAEELTHLGPDAREAALALVRTCADESEEVREWVVAALEDLGVPSPSDLGALTELLGDARADVAYWAATLIGRLQEQAAPAVAAMAKSLGSTEALHVRQRLAWALGQVGPAAAPALSVLQDAASSSDPRLARLAHEALEQIVG